LKVPDPDKCRTEQQDGIGHLHCDYGTLGVHVLAYPGRISLAQLKQAAAATFDEVPSGLWQWRATTLKGNGYRTAEAWSASSQGYSVLGLVGQSANGKLSHVALIYGRDGAWRNNIAEVEQFIDNVQVLSSG